MASLTAPWVLWRVREGPRQITLEWRNRAPLLAIVILVALELLFTSRAWMTLLLGLVTLTVVAGLWAWQLARWLRVERNLRFALVQVGDLLEERFVMSNDAIVPAMWVQVIDHGDVPGYDANTVRTVGARAEYRWVSRGECRLRGEYHLGPWETLAWDPFGIFAVVARTSTVETVLVYPSLARRLPFALPQGRSSGWAHTSHRAWEPTMNVGGVRAYVPGDPRHHIHWPTTARREQLFTKEFDQEAGGDVWLVLDLDRTVHVGSGERSSEEISVVVAGSAAAQLLDARRAVGLIAVGSSDISGGDGPMVMPGRGRGHLWTVLRALARARASAENPLGRVLEAAGRAIPSGSTALVITPSLEPDWLPGLAHLQGQGVGAAVIVVDADSFATRPAAARRPGGEGTAEPVVQSAALSRADALRGLLADAGIAAEVIRADTPLALRPPTGQVRRWEFKVLGTGRAVAVSTPWGD